MKFKQLGIALAAVMLAGYVFAETANVSLTITNNQPATASTAIAASGWFDAIEITQDSTAGTTSLVVVATYTGTTPIRVLYSNSVVGAVAEARPRFLGDDVTGTLLAAVVATGASTTNMTQVLSAPYERAMIGGNIKATVTGTNNDGSNPVTVRLFFEPTGR